MRGGDYTAEIGVVRFTQVAREVAEAALSRYRSPRSWRSSALCAMTTGRTARLIRICASTPTCAAPARVHSPDASS